MKPTTHKSQLITILLSATFYLLSSSLCGCEAFRRKFVRKPKKKKEVNVVITAQEYDSQYSIAETYKKYFSFWRAAHNELIDLLNIEDKSRKRRIFYANKIIADLKQMRQFLLPEKQQQLDLYIQEQRKITEELDQHNLRRTQRLDIKSALEKQKREIVKNFSYKYIREYLIEQ